MSSWKVASLSSDSWETARHLPYPGAVAAPPGMMGEARLLEVAETVQAQRLEGTGLLVVRPSDVSHRSGAIRPDQVDGAGFGFCLGTNLCEQDVLVPLRGNGPCVVVTSEMKRIAFSRAFAAFRPKHAAAASFLWAVLSATSGVLARRSLDRGAAVPRASVRELEQLELPRAPLPPERLDALLPNPAVDKTAVTALTSRWVSCNLDEESSWSPGELFDTRDYADGTRISDLGKLWSGRLAPRDFKAEPWEGSFAAIRPGDVGKLHAPLWWTTADAKDVAPAGSLLFGSISLRSGVADGRLAIGREIYVLEPSPREELRSEEVSRRLASYFSSTAGQKRLKSLVSGATIPRISKKAFGELRVPFPEELEDVDAKDNGTLAERLEAALWG